MDAIITSFGAITTWALSSVSAVATLVTGTPLVMFFIGLSVVGLGVGLLRRLMGL